ncbi:hypothetical protein PS1_002494 [Malus domestica]
MFGGARKFESLMDLQTIQGSKQALTKSQEHLNRNRSRTGYPLVLVAKFDSKFEILRRMHECMSPQLNISNVFVEMFLRFGKSLLRSLNGLEIHERFKFAGASEHEGV